MRSKLVFPSGGMETKYVWNKSTINDKGVFVWDKNYIDVENEYTWAKHLIDNSGIETHQWDRYTLNGDILYQWKRFDLKQTTDYIWNTYRVTSGYMAYRFANPKTSITFGDKTNLTLDNTNDYIYIYRAVGNGTQSSWTVSQIIKDNEYVVNAVFEKILWIKYKNQTYIFSGWGTSNTAKQAYVENGKLILKGVIPVSEAPIGYTYGKSNFTSYDYNIGSHYYLYEMTGVLSSPDINAYPVDQVSSGVYYDLLNDWGFFKVNNNNTFIPNRDSYVIVSSTNENAYPDGDFSYNGSTPQYYYERIENAIINPSKGDYVDTVTANKAYDYPTDGIKDDYWYVYNPIYIKTHYWSKYAPKAKHSWKRHNYNNYRVYTKKAPINKKFWDVAYTDTGTGSTAYMKWFRLEKIYVNYYLGDYYYQPHNYGTYNSEYSIMFSKNGTKQYTTYTPNLFEENSVFNTETVLESELYETFKYFGENDSKQASICPTPYIAIRGVDYDGDNTYSDYYRRILLMWNLNVSVYDGYVIVKFQEYLMPKNTASLDRDYLSLLAKSTVKDNAFPYYLEVSSPEYGNDHWDYGEENKVLGKVGYVLLNLLYDKLYYSPADYEDKIISIDEYFSKYYNREEDYYRLLGFDEDRKALIVEKIFELLNEDKNLYTFNLGHYSNGFYDYDEEYQIKYLNTDPMYMSYESEFFGVLMPYGEKVKDETYDVVYSYDITAYPLDGEQGSFWYEYITTEDDFEDKTYVEDVSSTNRSEYPDDGVKNGFYYIYSHYTEEDILQMGDYIEDVKVINNETAYPEDGVLDGYWYSYQTVSTRYLKGDYIERVEDIVDTSYPKDGIKGDYWYVYKGWETGERYEGRFIQQIESNDPNAYPTNGIDKNYWFKFVKSYEGYKLQITDAEIKGGIDYNIDVNPEEDYVVGTVASAEIAFEYNNVNRDIQQYIDANECIYYTWQPADNDWRQIGIFYLEDITEVRDTVKVKAYDSIIKTEAYIDELIESINDWPLNINQMFNKTCEYLGLNGVVSEEINNSNNFITDNFEAVNITGRQLLQYIAEAAGGLIMANANGALYLTKYRSKNISLDKSKYVRYVKHNYSTQPIEGVNVRVTSDDMGITAGADNGNVYIVENNPLFFDTTGTNTKTAVNNLYNKLKDVSYVPAEVELLQDFGINCGDIITVDEDTFYVMSKNLSPSGCKLKCVGNKHRQLKESGLNSDIVALRGKTNELYRDLEQTRSTLTDIEADLRTEITQTAEEIKLYAGNLSNNVYSSLQVDINSISSEVVNMEKELSSRIEQTESSISSTVTEQGRVITQIQQDLDGIDLVYNSENGTASITIGDITVTDLVNGEYVTRTVAGIDLTGYVTFHSLETAGATTINGSNITTGTIDAERINMRGAISWSDLSSDVQDAIDAGVSGDTDIPDYIKSTYIDGARIESPTINGGSLNSVAAYGDATHTTTIEDSQISFNIREYGSSGGSFGYTAGVIDAYVNDTGKPDSARTGLRVESYSDGSSYSGGLALIANRGLVLQSKNQDIFFYLPGRNPVALSTILDRLGL